MAAIHSTKGSTKCRHKLIRKVAVPCIFAYKMKVLLLLVIVACVAAADLRATRVLNENCPYYHTMDYCTEVRDVRGGVVVL